MIRSRFEHLLFFFGGGGLILGQLDRKGDIYLGFRQFTLENPFFGVQKVGVGSFVSHL